MSSDQKPDPARLVFLVSVGAIAALAIFAAGFMSAFMQNGVFRAFLSVAGSFQQVAEESENLLPTGDPIHFLQQSTHDGSGVTLNESGSDDLVLISGFFGDTNGLRLIRRDGTVLASWDVSFHDSFPNLDYLEWKPPQTDWNIDTHGALANPDGSVVFNFDYGGSVKLSRCGQTEWTLPMKTHHSIERAEAGGYWTLGRDIIGWRTDEEPLDPSYAPFSVLIPPEYLVDDSVLLVSEAGEILEHHSLTKIFFDSGLKGVLTATGMLYRGTDYWDGEIMHSNKLAELPSDIAKAFPLFEAGDLVLSLRDRNMIAVIDRATMKIKWHMIGPWLRQHDPEFGPDGRIYVFNNNTFFNLLDENSRLPVDAPRLTNILAVDPVTRDVDLVFGGKPGQEMMSVIRGKIDLTANGRVMITEFEAGRVLEVDADGTLVWEYINRFDETRVAEVTEARTYPESYFTVTDWTCP